MTRITIHNIGPIKNVSLKLNKINVFIGPQSSGKSTIAKIISYCSWYEKNAVLHTSKRPDFFEELMVFHNFEPSYFSSDSRIEYESEICKMDFTWNSEDSICNVLLGKDKIFKNRKISYIPAERNFVTLPGLGKYNETKDNVMSFMYEWFLAKNELTEKNAFSTPIMGLGNVSFYYDKDSDSDRICINNNCALKLNHASSGLRTCMPMLIVFNYIINDIYTTLRTQTPFEIIDIEEKLQFVKNGSDDSKENLKESIADLKNQLDELSNLFKYAKECNFDDKFPPNFNNLLLNMQEKLANAIGLYSQYFYSQVIIEEPELNLFPPTQQELVYHLLSVLNETAREHQLVLTTHSPYILFAINNCMMGGLVKNKIPNEEQSNFASHAAWINPSLVSIYEIFDGTIRSIQDEDGIIEDNYLNQAYKENSDEYLTMLNYFEDEE